MQQKSMPRLCRIHQQECIAIDMNPQCEFEGRHQCVKCLNNPIKAQHCFSYQDANQYMFKVKKVFKFQQEELNKVNVDILKQLIQEANYMEQSSYEAFNQLIKDLNKQIELLQNDSSIIDQQLSELDLDAYLSQQFEFTPQKLHIQEFRIQINQYQNSILQKVKQFSDKLGDLDDKKITLIPEVPLKQFEKVPIKTKPKLSFLCTLHDEEIRIYDHDETVLMEDKIICDECSFERKGPFTPITTLYKLWEEDKNINISLMKEQEEIFNYNVKIAQDQIKQIYLKILTMLQHVPNQILQLKQEQQKITQNYLKNLKREWSTLNRAEVLYIQFFNNILEFLNIFAQSQQNQFELILSHQSECQKQKEEEDVKKLQIGKKTFIQIQIFCLEYQFKEDYQLQKSQHKTVNYQILAGNSIFQKEFCYAIAIDYLSQTVIAGCNNNIKIFELKKAQLNQIQFLNDHQDYVSTLIFLTNTKKFISGSGDGQMRIYGYNNAQQWYCQQVLKEGHTNFVAQILTTKEENTIISCSGDQKIKFWTIKQDWTCLQTLQVHSSFVQGISLNESQNQLVSCGQDRQIVISQPGFQNRWSVFQIIKIEQFGYRICYINDRLIAFQPLNIDKMEIFEYDQRTKMFFQAKPKDACINLFPMQFNKAKQMLVKKNGQSVDFIKLQPNGELFIEQSISFGHHNLWGTLSQDGAYLITWDFASKQFQVRKQM